WIDEPTRAHATWPGVVSVASPGRGARSLVDCCVVRNLQLAGHDLAAGPGSLGSSRPDFGDYIAGAVGEEERRYFELDDPVLQTAMDVMPLKPWRQSCLDLIVERLSEEKQHRSYHV